MCQEAGCSPNWAQVGPGVQQLDEVNRVLTEEAHFAARETQALDTSAAEGETAAQGRVLAGLLAVLGQLAATLAVALAPDWTPAWSVPDP